MWIKCFNHVLKAAFLHCEKRHHVLAQVHCYGIYDVNPPLTRFGIRSAFGKGLENIGLLASKVTFFISTRLIGRLCSAQFLAFLVLQMCLVLR